MIGVENGPLSDRTVAMGLGRSGPFSSWRRQLLPDWGHLLSSRRDEWSRARREALGGPRILIPTMVGGLAHAGVMESLLAVALTLRGAEVEFLLCDGVLGACQLAAHDQTIQADRLVAHELKHVLCGACTAVGDSVFGGLGLKIHGLSSMLGPEDFASASAESEIVDIKDLQKFTSGGIPLGEHATAGALRFFATASLDDEPQGHGVLRRYLAAAILTAKAVSKLTLGRRFDQAVFHHGIYVPQGIVCSVLRRHGIKRVTWNPAYRRNCFIFSHEDSYHHTMMAEPVEAWDQTTLSAVDAQTSMEYLRSRMGGTRDWVWFHGKTSESRGTIDPILPNSPDGKILSLFTNVMWDARLHFRDIAYDDQMDWITDTVEWVRSREDIQLVIRIHPAEIRGTLPSRQKVADLLRQRIPRLPSNVTVLPPDHPTSSYALAAKSDAVLVFGSKAAIEFAAAGIEVVTVGDAWTRGKGLTRDPQNQRAYLETLVSLSSPVETRRVERARLYAHHIFLRRMIPLRSFEATSEDPPIRININSIDDLKPGLDPGLDTICDGIMYDLAFEFDASRYGSADGKLEFL